MKQIPFSLVGWIVLAYTLSIAVRLIWVYQFGDMESFKYAGQFMINTNDGYYWAEGARDLLSGVFQPNDLSPIHEAPAQLTYLLAKILPISFETLIFYMPAFLGALLVVPVVLIGDAFKMRDVGFLAGFLASITVSYYNRTMVGYYDTDMLNILFPTLLVWSLILAFRTKEPKYLFITALEIIAYRWWYPQSYSLEFAFFGLILLYVLIFERKTLFYYQLLAMMLLAMMNVEGWIRCVAVVGAYLFLRQTQWQRYTLYLFGLSLLLFFASGGVEPIWYRLKVYIFDTTIEQSGDLLPLHFFSVTQTIREAGQIPFTTFAERISGHTITFILGMIGYGVMAWRHREMLLALPMLGLGFLALFGGLRFTIYAVPIAALGAAYLLFTCSLYLQKALVQEKQGKIVKSLFVIFGALAMLHANVMHVIDYRVPTVFNKAEVESLVKLQSIADREDYVVTWWDYGYPIRYYSDVKTLIDGAKHTGDVNFPVSFALTSPQDKAAKMARFEVEYTEMAFSKAEKNETVMNNTAQMTLDAGFNDANDFLEALSTDITLPAKTRDIYFYLPYRMLGIFPTVAQFSNIDIMSGKPIRQPFFYQSNRFQDSASELNLGSGVVLNKQKGTLKIGPQEVPLKRFVKTSYGADKRLHVEGNALHESGVMSVIYMQAYNTFLVVDEAMFHSSYIQLFVLEAIDTRFFEVVSLEPHAKVFKLKI